MVCVPPLTAMAVSGLSTAGTEGLGVHEPVLRAEPNAGLLVGDGLDDLEERAEVGLVLLRKVQMEISRDPRP